MTTSPSPTPILIQTDASATWRGGFQGDGFVEAGELATAIDLPTGFGGKGAATSPEDLLAAALTACYGATIGIILDRRQIPHADLAVSLRMTTEKGVPSKVNHAAIRVSLRTDAPQEEVRAAVGDVEKWCIVSGATRGNVEKHLEVVLLPLRAQETGPGTATVAREVTAP